MRASLLRDQSNTMHERMGFFKLNEASAAGTSSSAPESAVEDAPAASVQTPVTAPIVRQSSAALAIDEEEDWSEF